MMNDEGNKPVHERLTEELIERLRQGVTPWRRTRQSSDLGAFISMDSAADKRFGSAAEGQRSAEEQIHEQRVHGWTGLMKIKGAVKRDGVVRWAEDMGVEPDFYRMYAQTKDNTFEWLCDYPTEQLAKNMAARLAGIFSMMNSEDTRRLFTSGARKGTPMSSDTSANSAARFLHVMFDRQRRLHRDP
ncbi:hypothetical protein [Burkholderia sp. L27(2015)]|uniref:hypothetical protein n=1 Tax=Burkholderia sp. L27(2015) TaxID=1641858 RepID=UPI00131D51D5|nr:hypothetical protein [Burkholderia sp. L27(2015)]